MLNEHGDNFGQISLVQRLAYLGGSLVLTHGILLKFYFASCFVFTGLTLLHICFYRFLGCNAIQHPPLLFVFHLQITRFVHIEPLLSSFLWDARGKSMYKNLQNPECKLLCSLFILVVYIFTILTLNICSDIAFIVIFSSPRTLMIFPWRGLKHADTWIAYMNGI